MAATGNTWPLKQLLDDLQFDVAQVPDGWLRQQAFRTDEFSDIGKPLLDACKKLYVDLRGSPAAFQAVDTLPAARQLFYKAQSCTLAVLCT